MPSRCQLWICKEENRSLGVWEEEAGKQELDSWTALKCPVMPLDWGLGILGTPGQVPQSKSSRRYQLKMNESTSASGTQKHAFIQEACLICLTVKM